MVLKERNALETQVIAAKSEVAALVQTTDALRREKEALDRELKLARLAGPPPSASSNTFLALQSGPGASANGGLTNKKENSGLMFNKSAEPLGEGTVGMLPDVREEVTAIRSDHGEVLAVRVQQIRNGEQQADHLAPVCTASGKILSVRINAKWGDQSIVDDGKVDTDLTAVRSHDHSRVLGVQVLPNRPPEHEFFTAVRGGSGQVLAVQIKGGKS